ncbi:hypothetical protein [Thiolapillus sp.]
MIKRIGISTCVVLQCFSSSIGHAGENSKPFSYSMGLSYLHGNLDGFLQTPAGGEPGTTSKNRPSFEELGFNRQSAVDAYGRISRGRHMLEIGGQWQRHSGRSILTEDLVSQKKFFAAGTRADADTQTDWYRLNYLYALNSAVENIYFAVGGGLVWFDFHYRLKSDTAKADRAYSKIGYRAGVNVNWKVNDRFVLDTQVFAPIPVSNTPEIWTLELDATYRLWNSGGRQLQGIAGIGYNRLDYEDNQKIPNHIRVEMAPYFRLGLNLDF